MKMTKQLNKGITEIMNVNDFHFIEVNQRSKEETKICNNALMSQTFAFNGVFGPETSQEDIFKQVNELVLSALDGYNVCIFAYGQTGSGKTYTMEGSVDDPSHVGIIPRSVDALFSHIEKATEEGWEFEVETSFLEIYWNEIRDLLAPENTMKHLNKANAFSPTTVKAQKAEDVHFLLIDARNNRVVEKNSVNEESSRSHSIFQLAIKARHAAITEGEFQEGTINLVDLAGSERCYLKVKDPKVLKESREINKSLSWLRDVMHQLATKTNHVRYRDSKLTYVLQPQLSSCSSKTLMIVNISPLKANVAETINSLRFASEVNTCGFKSKKKD